MTSIDLNADLGESFGTYTIGNDEEILKIISSANVACGFHGGDPVVMHKTIELAMANGVDIGAHPGFNDLWGFGRRRIVVQDASEVEKMLIYQVGAIQGMARAAGAEITHYKIHGALGNQACVEPDLAMATARALKAVAPELLFVVLPNTELEEAGEALGLRLAREIFADRAYEDDASLVRRGLPGAMIEDPKEASERIVRFVRQGAVESLSGKLIPMAIDTICVHGDSAHAIAMATELRRVLTEANIDIVSMAKTLA